jgi:hypothetical protein
MSPPRYSTLDDALNDGCITVADARRLIRDRTAEVFGAEGTSAETEDGSVSDTRPNCKSYGHIQIVEISAIELLGITMEPPHRFEVWADKRKGEAADTDSDEWPRTYARTTKTVIESRDSVPPKVLERSGEEQGSGEPPLISLFGEKELRTSIETALEDLGVPAEML